MANRIEHLLRGTRNDDGVRPPTRDADGPMDAIDEMHAGYWVLLCMAAFGNVTFWEDRLKRVDPLNFDLAELGMIAVCGERALAWQHAASDCFAEFRASLRETR